MAVLRQTRAGFKTRNKRSFGFGMGKSVNDAILSSKIYKVDVKKITQKILNASKAKQMLKIVKPNFLPILEEMFKLINANPLIVKEDLAVQVIRNLKQTRPNEFYATGAVGRLFSQAVKYGAIKSKKS